MSLTTKNGGPVPDVLADAIKADAERLAQWSRARPSCQARYAEHVAEAKKPETRERRVALVLHQMAETYGGQAR